MPMIYRYEMIEVYSVAIHGIVEADDREKIRAGMPGIVLHAQGGQYCGLLQIRSQFNGGWKQEAGSN